jgi:transglutaminase-like putative cysteine protease
LVADMSAKDGIQRIRVTHETHYVYRPAVTTAWHQAHLEPGDSPCQRVLHIERQVLPQPTFAHNTIDAFGNHEWFFSQELAHESLSVRVVSRLETWPVVLPPEAGSEAWETMKEALSYRPAEPSLRESLFAYPTSYVPRGAEFLAFSADAFTAGRSLRDCCIALTALIYQGFEYNPHTTTIHTPTRIALQQRSGVCQDFAHIMLACLRSRGLAARYVSGYLMTEPLEGQARLVGADASHAWVSVFLGDGQWLDCDPTNNRYGLHSPGTDYIRLAVGRDFADISPLRGVMHGGTQHQLTVGVTVEPEGDTLRLAHDHAL